jgi:hypothetical protein
VPTTNAKRKRNNDPNRKTNQEENVNLSIRLTIKGKSIELTEEELTELYNKLHTLIGQTSTPITYPIYIREHKYWPYWNEIWASQDTGNITVSYSQTQED